VIRDLSHILWLGFGLVHTINRGETIMLKILLAAAVLMVSLTAHADPSFRVAADDPPQAKPAETAATPTEPTQAAEPVKATDPAKAAEPAPVAETKPVQTQTPKTRPARRESDEHKARRIAAKFGVYW
jgi:outer membrane biosynthesis protein TonB